MRQDKMYWRGEDVDQLPREKLVEIIRHLNDQLESTRKAAKSIIEIHEMARAARR